jgi:hypothetical protein
MLLWDLNAKTAVITVSCDYVFSSAALARTIAHELLELSTITMWSIYAEVVRNIVDDTLRTTFIDRMRNERDAMIEQRLQEFPFFRNVDVPVPAQAIGGVCVFEF